MAFTIQDLPALLETVPPGSYVAISMEDGRVLAFDEDYLKVFAQRDLLDVKDTLIARRPFQDQLLFF